MALTTTQANMVLGNRDNARQMTFGIPAGPDGEDPGLLVLEGVNAAGDTYNRLYLWADSSNNLRYNTSKPTDEDADGYALDNTTIGAAANKQLDNLASVAIPCDLASDTDSTDNLGTSSIYWKYSYIDRMYVNSTAYIDGAVAGEIALIGNVDIGVSGTGKDMNIFGDNYDFMWDASADTLYAKDNAVLAIGTGGDVTIKHDGTDTHIDGGSANNVLKFGDGTTLDLYFCGANDDILFDASADKMMLQDTFLLGFGTGASTNGDITFAYDGSGNHLDINQVAAGTGDIQIGVDGKGIDVKYFAETASDYMLWDQDGASNVGALTFVDSAIVFDSTNVDYTLQATTDALSLIATDHASAELTFGSTGTNGMDVVFQGQASGDHVKFDAGAGTWTYTDINTTYTGADSSGTLLAITGIDTTGNSDTVTIDHSGSGNALYIDLNEADSQGITVEPYTNSTVAAVEIDGDAAGWKGADNVGMLHLRNDVAHAHAGASMLYVDYSAQPVASAEGFLARFVSTGTARTNATAVEIEVPATQPAFAANGIVSITGQDNPGAALVQITGIDTTGNTDTMTIDHSGSGNALYIDQNEADSQAITTEPFTNSTVASIEVDGDTAGWLGADGVGMVHLKNDIALGHANASMLLIDKSAAIAEVNSAAGSCLRIVENMNAAASGTAYAAYISSTNNEALHVDSGIVKIDEYIQSRGYQMTNTAITANDAGDGTAIIPDGGGFYTVDADSDADHIVTLPTPTPGTVVWLQMDGTGCELRSDTPASVAINGGSGANAETAMDANKTYRAICTSSTTWVVTEFNTDGTEAKADAASA